MNDHEKDSHDELGMPFEETAIKAVFKKFGNQKDVSLIYGEPVEVGLTKVIPVAKLKYAIGGGGETGGGEGGGGFFSIKPVGVYEITPDHVKFKSATNYRKLATFGVIVTGIIGILISCKK
ncbi:hypothetical protein DVB69_14920 [Sporosarcina sp. BI001-red]|uniref:hypothetical protein n=1 Tax=Sporosarcina sp. BI001-red TaxID=2282866 RepID=UPI000E256A99|nr:hypothetical protein [Sporosarcina sp. BI001-red]REB05559.1 hypothetical protein DVB69_14920 [Sporosarcina sp. BI001-red]